jgi:hypothetical protein
MNASRIKVPNCGTRSLTFAELEVRRCHASVLRAAAHLDLVNALEIPTLETFARAACKTAVRAYRSALGKRGWEIRQLLA